MKPREAITRTNQAVKISPRKDLQRRSQKLPRKPRHLVRKMKTIRRTMKRKKRNQRRMRRRGGEDLQRMEDLLERRSQRKNPGRGRERVSTFSTTHDLNCRENFRDLGR